MYRGVITISVTLLTCVFITSAWPIGLQSGYTSSGCSHTPYFSACSRAPIT